MRIITLLTAATIAGTSMASAASLSDVDRNDDGKISFQEWDHTYGTEKGIIFLPSDPLFRNRTAAIR